MRISDWSSDVCSSDLQDVGAERVKNFLKFRQGHHRPLVGIAMKEEAKTGFADPGHMRQPALRGVPHSHGLKDQGYVIPLRLVALAGLHTLRPHFGKR